MKKPNAIVVSKEDAESIEHFGVVGMKWGVRRNRSAARQARRDQKSLSSVGLKRSAAAVGRVAAKSEGKAAAGEAKIKAKQAAGEAKKAAKAAKAQQKADDMQENAKGVIELNKKQMKSMGFKQERIDRETKWLEGFYQKELNATPQSMKVERRKNVAKVAAALAIYGTLRVTQYKVVGN